MEYLAEKDINWSDGRRAIVALQTTIEEGIESGAFEKYEGKLTHHFAPGLYAREFFMEAGKVVVGKIHKHAHVNTISKGHVVVSTEHGEDPIEYVAPITFVSVPGTKRAVHVLEDTIWTTYHPTEETDLKKIEEDVIAETFEDLEVFLCYEQMERLT